MTKVPLGDGARCNMTVLCDAAYGTAARDAFPRPRAGHSFDLTATRRNSARTCRSMLRRYAAHRTASRRSRIV